MSENPNPPAFPTRFDPDSHAGQRVSGMSLRDWFAGQALPAAIGAVVAGKVPLENFIGPPAETAASIAYIMADAMLAQRTLLAKIGGDVG